MKPKLLLCLALVLSGLFTKNVMALSVADLVDPTNIKNLPFEVRVTSKADDNHFIIIVDPKSDGSETLDGAS